MSADLPDSVREYLDQLETALGEPGGAQRLIDATVTSARDGDPDARSFLREYRLSLLRAGYSVPLDPDGP